MKQKKRLIPLAVCVLLVILCFCGCASSNAEPTVTGVTIPNLAGTDVESAKTILAGKGLIPIVAKEESESYEEGIVIRTEPAAGETAEVDASVTIVVSSGSSLKVPPVIGDQEEQAASQLKRLGLNVETEYEYDDGIEEGFVIRTMPDVGDVVKENDTVTLYVSLGSETVSTQQSYLSWYNLSEGQDDWEFDNPYRTSEYLVIVCNNVTIQKSFEWQDRYENGFGGGVACLNDTFDKKVPIKIEYEDVAVKKGEPFSITIRIPLKELETINPTDLYMELYTCKEHTDTKTTPIRLSLTMTW